MIELVVITSLKILFVYEAMKEGMILFPLRKLFEKGLNYLPIVAKHYLCKPLYCCLFCMSSIWGFIFTAKYAAFTWDYAVLLFSIGGLNFLIACLLQITNYYEGQADK